MADGMNDFDRVECPGCGMMLRPLYEGHVCTGMAGMGDPVVVPLSARPVWWRLDNPDAVQVEVLHRDPHEHGLLSADRVCLPARHTVRVTQTDTQTLDTGVVVETTRTATAELLVGSQTGFDALFDAGRIAAGMLHFCMVTPPAVGEWTRIEPLEANDPPADVGGGIIGGVRDR